MKPVAVQLAVANILDRVEPEEVYAFIETEGEGIVTYAAAPPPPGSIQNVACDFMLVLSAAGSVASLASLLWLAYEKFIAGKKTERPNAGIVLTIPRDDGPPVTFWIGHQHKDRDLFVRDFTARVDAIRESNEGGKSTEQVSVEVKFAGRWIRRK